MKFKFRFKPLLKVKEHNLTKQQILLNHLNNNRNESMRVVQNIYNDMLSFDRELEDEPISDLPINRYLIERNAIDEASLRIMRENRKIQQMEKHIDQQKQKLVEASREVKTLKNIEERDKLRYIREQEAREVAELNEIATLMHNRQYDEY
ncbi:MAG: hypothetical protein EA364_09215 [Balneolaceae bacterium]|nr:MAG: hypothetical protein EA364_09215 [Balneolaceae bacterium]